MRNIIAGLAVIAAASLIITLVSHHSVGQGQAAGGPRAVSALGVTQIQGRDAFVEIVVVVPPGQDEQAVVDNALQEQGARRAAPGDLQSANFTTSFVWPQFSDTNPGNNFVIQNYNLASDPTSGGGATALTNSQATWSSVPTSSFAFQYGGLTTRCPSLVDECPGVQVFDTYNDVAWLALGDNILGVTWFGTATREADVALSTNFSWNTGCANVSGKFDAQTVFTHENGHVAGLGHSRNLNAVMYPSYSVARCVLGQDDINGISFLYPASGTSGPTPTSTATATPTATSTPGGPTPTSTPCPPGHRKNGRC